jgi:hypothetical protein
MVLEIAMRSKDASINNANHATEVGPNAIPEILAGTRVEMILCPGWRAALQKRSNQYQNPIERRPQGLDVKGQTST